jgi:hypothetical protein
VVAYSRKPGPKKITSLALFALFQRLLDSSWRVL